MGADIVKRVLMIAYHFPPIRHSSGIQRTLNFARYLRDHGWQPIILTINPMAYPATGQDQMADVPDDVIVHRAFGLDTARHLSVAGRYPGFMARPDRYASWLPGAVFAGLRLIRRYKPQAIFSTYPIATAHAIGGWLERLSGLPWVADFRDSMTEDDFPVEPAVWRSYRKIEQRVMVHCDRALFTTPGTLDMYRERYPEVRSERLLVIPNGYDEEAFAAAEQVCRKPDDSADVGPKRIVHAGLLYPNERDPRPFFAAVKQLKAQGVIRADKLIWVLRATGHDDIYRPLLHELGIDDVVRLEPAVGYRDALAEMLCADGLLLFQAANCNHQIPAKLYEYLRARRPIIALTDPAGDTARALRDANTGVIGRLDDADDIEAVIRRFLLDLEQGAFTPAGGAVIRQYERANTAARLAEVLDGVVTE